MAKLLGLLAFLSYITGPHAIFQLKCLTDTPNVFIDTCVSAVRCSTADTFDHYYVNCDDGCCGYYYDRKCCTPANAGVIAGTVIGTIFFFACVVVLTLVIKKYITWKTGVVVAGETDSEWGQRHCG